MVAHIISSRTWVVEAGWSLWGQSQSVHSRPARTTWGDPDSNKKNRRKKPHKMKMIKSPKGRKINVFLGNAAQWHYKPHPSKPDLSHHPVLSASGRCLLSITGTLLLFSFSPHKWWLSQTGKSLKGGSLRGGWYVPIKRLFCWLLFRTTVLPWHLTFAENIDIKEAWTQLCVNYIHKQNSSIYL